MMTCNPDSAHNQHEGRAALAHDGQELREHLKNVSIMCSRYASKIGCSEYGRLLGLLHDLGKYNRQFQEYIRSALGLLDPDADGDYVEYEELRGKIDHSTVGAQLLWREIASRGPAYHILGQALSLCLVSHHSGLIDCIKTSDQGTTDNFSRRINKPLEWTYLSESSEAKKVMDEVLSILRSETLVAPLQNALRRIIESAPQPNQQSTVVMFQFGLWTRMLFSCLLDADREDSADAENPRAAGLRQKGIYREWAILIQRLESHLERFSGSTIIDRIRKRVSNHCWEASTRPKGLFTLTVPTGGGKTLASLRFALGHAAAHNLDRVIYIVPFTTIIDQNAEQVRAILESKGICEEIGTVVLEHHSNIGAERQSWKEKLLCENWDAPVVFTTMVQLLEALFGGGTRGPRRMHQLAKAVIIFDEIQSLPIRCAHMFCNAVNFLINQCGSSVVLCTATQPLLGGIDSDKGALALSKSNEIVPNVLELFECLKRVEVCDMRKPSGWSEKEIGKFALSEARKSGSCLVVVNTRRSARQLVKTIQEIAGEAGRDMGIAHLSTSMCPAHSSTLLDAIPG